MEISLIWSHLGKKYHHSKFCISKRIIRTLNSRLERLHVNFKPSSLLLDRKIGTGIDQPSFARFLPSEVASLRICLNRQIRIATGWATNKWQDFCCPCSCLCSIRSPCNQIKIMIFGFWEFYWLSNFDTLNNFVNFVDFVNFIDFVDC